MKWNDIKSFTWNELSALQWCNLTEHESELLQKYWNGELQLSSDTEHKLQLLCKPFAMEYNKHYENKFSIKDFLSDASAAVALIRNVLEMGEKYKEFFKELLHSVFELLQ